MGKNVYITNLSSFLPNEPVENDAMEDVLGYIGGHSSRIKRIILSQNQIKQRYYAIKNGNYTHTNAELMANAIAGLFDDKFTANDVQLLSCGTSTPDQMMPSHASMVHGLLKDSNPIPILSPSGVCCSAAHALEYCFLSVLSGHTNNAICGGSELFSPLLRSNIFEEEYKMMNEIQSNPYIAFEKDFLRWMLSDGAGCALLSDMPSDGISLKIEWIESVSYANELDVCMSQGLQKTVSGEWASWKLMRPIDWQMQSIFAIKQDIKLLAKYGVEKSVQHIANSCNTRELHHSGYERIIEEAVDLFLENKNLSIKSMLDKKSWIPVVSKSKICLLNKVEIEDTIYVVFDVKNILFNRLYEADIIFFKVIDNKLLEVAHGEISHGYSDIKEPQNPELVVLDCETLKALKYEKA